MLRLVHPAPAGQGPDAPRRRRLPVASLSTDEKRHLRTALHNLRRSFGTWACLADAIGVKVNTLLTAARERNPVGSPGIAIRAARAGGVSVESILTGAITAAGRCDACGHRIGHGVALATGGAR